jgi:uncharacterized protein
VQPVCRRDVLALLGFLAGCSRARQDDQVFVGGPRRHVSDVLSPAHLGDVRLRGYLGAKLDACIANRIFAQDPGALVAPFRRRTERHCWQTEFWGKWALSSAAACEYKQSGRDRERLLASAHELLATQSNDGYIGNYAEDSHLAGWDIWGRKYTLLGLLASFDLSGDRTFLDGANRLAAHLEGEVGPGKADIVTHGLYRGMASSSVLDPIVALARRTGSEAHLRFAEYIVSRWSSAKGPRLIEKALAGVPVASRFPPPKKWFSWENGGKAYEMMSCYTGLLELYRETGRAPYLEAALRTHRNIRETEINVAGSGSADECWYGGRASQTQPAHNMMETCVTASWMQFSAHLLRLTGDPRFAGDIEAAAYNALAGAMTPDGSAFGKYSALEGERELGPAQCGMELNCCMANGPRGLMLLPAIAVMAGADGPVVNLYEEGEWRLALRSGRLARLEIATEYPFSGTVDLRLRLEQPEPFALRLRIPDWSAETSVAVNGSPVSGIRPGSYAAIERRWTSSDKVRLQLDMRARVLRPPGDAAGQFVAVSRGPLVLARDLRLGQSGVETAVNLAAGKDGYLPLKTIPKIEGIGMAFAAPQTSDGDVGLCAYASAGSSWDKRSRFQVWMRQAT